VRCRDGRAAFTGRRAASFDVSLDASVPDLAGSSARWVANDLVAADDFFTGASILALDGSVVRSVPAFDVGRDRDAAPGYGTIVVRTIERLGGFERVDVIPVVRKALDLDRRISRAPGSSMTGASGTCWSRTAAATSGCRSSTAGCSSMQRPRPRTCGQSAAVLQGALRLSATQYNRRSALRALGLREPLEWRPEEDSVMLRATPVSLASETFRVLARSAQVLLFPGRT
jgi:hypothetical protein